MIKKLILTLALIILLIQPVYARDGYHNGNGIVAGAIAGLIIGEAITHPYYYPYEYPVYTQPYVQYIAPPVQECRNYIRQYIVNGYLEETYGVMCLQPDGYWIVVQ